MSTNQWAAALTGTVALVSTLACGRSPAPEPFVDNRMNDVSYVFAAEADTFPRLRFGDGQVSLNDRCPVRKVKLNRRMPPLRVNGQHIGFC